MTDRDALFRAVLDRPDDDTPRLAFADWLDEHGSAADRTRAAFIRLQCETARAEPWGAHWHQLCRKEGRLELKHFDLWTAPVKAAVKARFARLSRGFVEEVTVSAKRFVADGAALFGLEPIRAVKFVDMAGGQGAVPADELADCPHLARLHTVELVGRATDDRYLGRFVRSPHLAGLRSLRLTGCDLGPAAMRAVLEAPTLPALRELHVGTREDYGPAAGCEHLAALARSPGLAKLRVLDLWGTAAGPDGARALAASRHAAGLETLVLGFTRWKSGAMKAAAADILPPSQYLRNLRDLTVQAHQLRKKGGEAFARAANWPALRRLSLRANEIPASALPAFAENPALKGLAELDLTGNKIRRADTDAIRAVLPNVLVLTDDHPG